MKIAFVADRYLDPANPNSWSGLPYHMRRALKGAGLEIEDCVVGDPGAAGTLLRFAYWKWARGRRYLRNVDSRALRRQAAEIERRVAAMGADAIFCPSSLPVAYLRAPIPTVFWTDAGFAGMVGFYESFSNLAPPSVRDGHAAEQAALRNCARAIYSSEWAATTARECYSAEASRVAVVPFGANIEGRPPMREVEAFVSARTRARCNLLLIGVDWRRKGADVAVEVARNLNERGWPAHLTVAGCVPPGPRPLPPYVTVIPFIEKSTPEGRVRFQETCRSSHLLVMPTRADCTPVAIAEANCFGLPCLSTLIGGIPSLVADEVNGRLFGAGAPPSEYADYVIRLMLDPARYRALALGSAAHAELHFNWNASAARVAAILGEVAARPGARRRTQAPALEEKTGVPQ